MCKALTCLFSSVMLLGLLLAGVADAADPSLVAHYRLDEGAGFVATDSSGNGYDGTLLGQPQWVLGPDDSGVALAFNPNDACTGIECPTFDPTDGTGQFSFTIWAFWDGEETYHHFFTKSDGWGQATMMFQLELWGGSTSAAHFNRVGISYDPDSTPFYEMPKNEWTHLAFVYDGAEMVVYLNGVDDMGPKAVTIGSGPVNARTVIGVADNDVRVWTGALDDVQIYSRPLAAGEVVKIMEGNVGLSSGPQPEHEATDVPRDVVLGWTAGEFASTHDVYLGTVFDDVNDADRSDPRGTLVSESQAATSYDPEGLLAVDQTYYWRVDEVNSAPDYAIFKGEVWSFTTEPTGYPLANIVATSNADTVEGAGPENTVNGSGLNADDQHSVAATDMWLGTPSGGEPIWIQYEFDRVYNLHEMLVWNYNSQFELVLGFGVKDVTVEYSVDGTDWTSLGDVELAQGTALATYAANTTIDLAGAAARYVRLTVNSGWGMMSDQVGLSEVRFFFIPVKAREPMPVDGEAGVGIDAVLSWRAGREAVSHEVYFSSDQQAVAEGTAPANAVDERSYTPGALDYGTTYYWKVNEVNAAAVVAVWEGNLWSFSTQEFVTIEDFEGYNDTDNVIYETWIDGWVNETGSTVGYLEAPFAERTIVHDGRQSMPLFYDNAGVATAGADFTVGQNWTANGLRSLSLYFYGDPDNTGQLYIKIDNTKVVYDGDAGDISLATWQVWNIDLSTSGANASNVGTLTIGIEGAGATGVVYIDDIRLYPKTPEVVMPVEPDPAGLVLYYALDEGSGSVVTDSSGSGNNGTIEGSPAWIAGVSGGSALSFDGSRDYVTAGQSLLDGLPAFTIACWLKGDLSQSDRTGLVGQNDCVEYGVISSNAIQIWTPGGGSVNLDWPYDADADWHSIVAVGDGQSLTIYLDGKAAASGGSLVADNYGTSTFPVNIGGGGIFDDAGNWFTGDVDEIYIYQRALSAPEVAGLAGMTTVIHQPF
jgi:Concanavalin A-like lectin/glucanases superfamily/F5/8 type C domain